MLIAYHIQIFVVLLGLAILFRLVKSEGQYNKTLVQNRRINHNGRGNKHRHAVHLDKLHFFHGKYYPYFHETELLFKPGQLLPPRHNRQLLEEDYLLMNNSGPGVDCCPSVFEMIEPDGGKNNQDIYVELYKSDNYRQRFYEISCHKDVLNKPCRFMDKHIHPNSKCVQMHSFTYALVKDTPDRKNKNIPTFPGAGSGNNSYVLDYISVRSGCSCVVMPPHKKKKRNKSKDHKRKGKGSHYNVPVLAEAVDENDML